MSEAVLLNRRWLIEELVAETGSEIKYVIEWIEYDLATVDWGYFLEWVFQKVNAQRREQKKENRQRAFKV